MERTGGGAEWGSGGADGGGVEPAGGTAGGRRLRVRDHVLSDRRMSAHRVVVETFASYARRMVPTGPDR